MVILKFLKRRNRYVNFFMINVTLLAITILICGISAFLVSRLGPHGGIRLDNCDKSYIIWAKISYGFMVVINSLSIVVTTWEWYKDKKKLEKYFNSGYKESYKSDENVDQGKKEDNNQGKFSLGLDMNIDKDRIKEKASEVKNLVGEKISQIKDMIGNKDK